MLLKPWQEWRRERATRALRILDTPREPEFDAFVACAAAAFGAPLSFLSIVSGDRQWFKASFGSALHATGREDSFCAHALAADDLLEVCDAFFDPRFTMNTLVHGGPGIRYYLGAPLRLSSGLAAGALCVIDTVPRPPAGEDLRAYLRALARQASHALEQRADRKGIAR